MTAQCTVEGLQMDNADRRVRQAVSFYPQSDRCFYEHESDQSSNESSELIDFPIAHASANWAELPDDLLTDLLPQLAKNMRGVCRSWRDLATVRLKELRPNRKMDLQHLQKLVLKFPQLTHLNLSNCPALTADDLTKLQPLARLQSLNLCNRWSIEGAQCSAFASMTKLEHLDLSNWLFGADADLAAIEHLKQLKSLNLERCGGVGERLLSAVTRLQNLSILDLSNCKQTELGGLEILSSLKHLVRLDLKRCRGDNATLIALSSLSKISELNLTGFSNCSETCFTALRTLRVLRCANFSDCTQLSIGSLRGGLEGKNLRVLNLKGCELLCMKSYELIGRITSLRKLTLSHSSSMNDQNCQLLAPLSKLNDLDIRSTFVTEKSFAQINRWSDLKSLALDHCYMMQFDQLTQLRALRLDSLGASMRKSSSDTALAALGRDFSLNSLNLWGNGAVSDQALTALLSLTRLKHLQLADLTSVTERGLRYVMELKHLRSLRCVNCKSVDQESQMRLICSNKSIEISFSTN